MLPPTTTADTGHACRSCPQSASAGTEAGGSQGPLAMQMADSGGVGNGGVSHIGHRHGGMLTRSSSLKLCRASTEAMESSGVATATVSGSKLKCF